MSQKLSTEIFIERAIEKFGNKYDYSLVEYKNNRTKIKIICPIHGEFETTPETHLASTYGCKRCGASQGYGGNRWTVDKFVIEANKVHNDKFDYSLIKSIKLNQKVKIICPTHGIFEQVAYDHLVGRGCRKCSNEEMAIVRALSYEDFVRKANEIHNNKYDYSQVIYKNVNIPVTIICPIHGHFQQTPSEHLYNKGGCSKCSGKYKRTFQEFVNEANIIHNFKYDYSRSVFTGMVEKIEIICPIHGSFFKRPTDHIHRKRGCPICSGVAKSNTEEFINKAIQKHGLIYDYSLVDYKNAKTKVKIICNKHGVFEQTPNDHLYGYACPLCSHIISKTETAWLNSLGMSRDIRNIDIILYDGSKTNVDAYVSETNTVYEFMGDYFHGNPAVFPPDEMNKKVKKTYGELYEKTVSKIEKIKKSGYNLVVMWENDWRNILRQS